MSSDVEKIKEKLSIVDVVGTYVKLQKAGNTYKGKSPFTQERTPSFFVSPDKNLFHCFSSGKGGDIFTFIQEVENVDFPTALKMLAEKAGVVLRKTDRRENNERTQLYDVVEYATKIYEVAFRKDKDAVQYLLDRGMNKETMKKFRIGYAPQGWDYLYTALQKQGFSHALIEKAGLCLPGKQGKQGMYDRFRERIMFPITDGQGRVVAFTGRIFLKPDSPTDPKSSGKYVNSPETPIYHKSNILYGYDKAKRSMMTEDRCVLVEGQMDLIMSHQAGVDYAVAISGTALTEEQVNLIKRFTDVLIIALDADDAGVAAAGRSVKIAYAHDMQVSVVLLEKGHDPADIIKKDPEQWNKTILEATDYIDFVLHVLADKKLPQRAASKTIHNDVYPLLSIMKNSIEQDSALQKISHFLGTSSDAVRSDFERWKTEQSSESKDILVKTNDKKNISDNVRDNKENTFESMLFGIFLWQENSQKPLIDTHVYKKRYRTIVGDVWFDKAWQYAEAKKSSLIFEAELRYDALTPEDIVREIESLLTTALLRTLEKKQSHIMQKLRQAEQSGDDEQSNALLKEYQVIAHKIEEITRTRMKS